MAREKELAIIQNESVSKKKSILHFKRMLRNGQVAHLWIYKWKPIIDKDWGCTLYIGNSDKAARLWENGKKEADITGTTSIEGLKWAMDKLSWIANNLPTDHTLIIQGEDNRRTELYSKMINKQLKYFEQEGLQNCAVRYMFKDAFCEHVVTVGGERCRVND